LGDNVQPVSALINSCRTAVSPDNIPQPEEDCLHSSSSPLELHPCKGREDFVLLSAVTYSSVCSPNKKFVLVKKNLVSLRCKKYEDR